MEKMRSCELCGGVAKVYCKSDLANLCLSCDARVHSANFLVARHSRRLLCHVCRSPTPWSASGGELGFAVSLCEICVAQSGTRRRMAAAESEGEYEYDDEDEEEEIEISSSEDFQVVPPSQPPPENSSCSENSFCGGDEESVFSKRLRDCNTDLCSDDGCGCSVFMENSDKSPAVSSFDMARPMKIRKREGGQTGRVGS